MRRRKTENPPADGSLSPFGRARREIHASPLAELRLQTKITNRLGLHARAAARLAAALEEFDAEVFIARGPDRADAKSILDMLSLSCSRNTEVTVFSSGREAAAALAAAQKIIESRFGEDE
ncbi:MAG: HPr family phosphocarrier protein [Deltaproteobacteria bacterium]|jgi:phosphocarrier protein|nr:HPr family phosphocarrier protein [Deltaproteobacteria bacterium]